MRVCVTSFITTVAVGVSDPDFSKPLMTAVYCCTFELTMDCSCWVVTMYSLVPGQKLSSYPPQSLQPKRPATQVNGSTISLGSSMCWVNSSVHFPPQTLTVKVLEVASVFVKELPGSLRRPETSKQEMAWAARVQKSATSKHTHFDAFHHIARHFETNMTGSLWVAVIPADDALEVVFVQPVSDCPLEESQQFCRHLPLS